MQNGAFKAYFPYLQGRDTFSQQYLTLEEQDEEGRSREKVSMDEKVEALAVPELLMQILRNRINDPKLIKKIRADQASVIDIGYTKEGRTFVNKLSVGQDSKLFVQPARGSTINGFPEVITMWDKNSKKRRLYRKITQGGGQTAESAFAHYIHLEGLGEQNKFFEVYPEEIAPESIHPDNTDVDPNATPKSKKTTGPDPTLTDPADNTDIVATDDNIINQSLEQQKLYAEGETTIEVGEEMDELVVRGSKEFEDAAKKAQEDGDSQIKCN